MNMKVIHETYPFRVEDKNKAAKKFAEMYKEDPNFPFILEFCDDDVDAFPNTAVIRLRNGYNYLDLDIGIRYYDKLANLIKQIIDSNPNPVVPVFLSDENKKHSIELIDELWGWGYEISKKHVIRKKVKYHRTLVIKDNINYPAPFFKTEKELEWEKLKKTVFLNSIGLKGEFIKKWNKEGEFYQLYFKIKLKEFVRWLTNSNFENIDIVINESPYPNLLWNGDERIKEEIIKKATKISKKGILGLIKPKHLYLINIYEYYYLSN